MLNGKVFIAGTGVLTVAILVFVAAASSFGGDGVRPSAEVQSISRQADEAPTQAVSLSLAPTPAPTTPAPPPTPPPAPTEPPPPPPPPAPAALPDRASCSEIRGTDYRSLAEESFFRANCLGGPAPAVRVPTGAPPAPPPPSVAAAPNNSEAEAVYRSKASAQLAYFAAQMKQAVDATTPTSYQSYILTTSALVSNFINALDGLQPVPPRFRSVHDDLRTALVDFRTDWQKGQGITSLPQFVTWYAGMEALAKRADQAIASYNAVVGTNIPRLR